MKLKILFAALMVAAVQKTCFAQTPNMDREKDAIYDYLYKQGMSTAPTDIYLIATAYLQNDICGEAKMPRSRVDFYVETHGQSVEMPRKVLMAWVERMRQKLKAVLLVYPAEAQAFCK